MELLNTLIARLKTSAGRLESIERGRRVSKSFADVHRDVLRVAAFLQSRGVVHGARVGIVGANCYEWVVADLACLALGAVSVPFDAENRHSLDAVFPRFELKVLLTDDEQYLHDARVGSFAQALATPPLEEERFRPARYAPDDFHTIKFTSGSTSSPKCIESRVKSADATLANVQGIFHHGPGDKVMVFLPLFVLQQRYWVYSAILFDFAVLVIPYSFAFRALSVEKPTVVMGVPAFFEELRVYLQQRGGTKTVAEHLGGKVRYLWTGSAPLAEKTLAFYQEAGIPLYQGYGSNEACIVSKNYLGHDRPGSVGRPLPGKHITIAEDGEILVRCDAEVNDRYFGIPLEESRAVFRADGQIATGDMGYLDPDGYLFITGRKKDVLILSSGRKLHPALVERRVEALPGVKRCLLYGDDRPYAVALLAIEDGASAEQLRAEVDRLNGTLERDQRVHSFITVPEDELERRQLLSAQRKVKRKEALAVFQPQLDQLYRATREPPRAGRD